MKLQPVRRIAAFACMAALGACSGGTADNRGAAGDTATSAVSPPAAAPQAPPAAPAPGAMTDANIAAVASASNQDEIQTSRVALEKGENAGVKQFAQRMVDEHTRMEQEMTQLLQSKGVAPQDNPQSTQMKQAAQAALQQMQAASRRQLDSMYVAHQVQAHQATLQALDSMLIPNATDAQVRAMLEKARPAVAQHLGEAQRLQGTLR